MARHGRRRDAHLLEELKAAQGGLAARGLCDHPHAVALANVRQWPVILCRDERGQRAAHRVAAGGTQARRQHSQLVLADRRRVNGSNLEQMQGAESQSPRLIDDERGRVGKFLEEGRAANQYSMPRGDCDSGDRGGGRRERQRTRTRRDDDREHRLRIVADEPGDRRHQEHQDQVPTGIALE